MGTECSYGPMEQNTKVTGLAGKQTERASSHMLMEMFMKEIGRTIRPAASVSIRTIMGRGMRENGSRIISMEEAVRRGSTVAAMMDNTAKERSTETGNTFGGTAAIMRVLGKTTRSLDLACMYGQMGADTLESGLTIKCTAEASTRGKMAGSTVVNTSTTRSMVMVNTHGPMGEDMWENGLIASVMAEERSYPLTVMSERVSGSRTDAYDGWTRAVRPVT